MSSRISTDVPTASKISALFSDLSTSSKKIEPLFGPTFMLSNTLDESLLSISRSKCFGPMAPTSPMTSVSPTSASGGIRSFSFSLKKDYTCPNMGCLNIGKNDYGNFCSKFCMYEAKNCRNYNICTVCSQKFCVVDSDVCGLRCLHNPNRIPK